MGVKRDGPTSADVWYQSVVHQSNDSVARPKFGGAKSTDSDKRIRVSVGDRRKMTSKDRGI